MSFLVAKCVILIAAGLAAAPLAAAGEVDVAVVVNEKNPVANLSRLELRKIFAGEKRTWPGGTPIKLLVRAPGAHERDLLLKFLGMSEHEFKQYWVALVFRGDAHEEPLALPSNGMQKEALAIYPGAVCLMDAPDVKQGMKVVRVDGRIPGETGYPMH